MVLPLFYYSNQQVTAKNFNRYYTTFNFQVVNLIEHLNLNCQNLKQLSPARENFEKPFAACAQKACFTFTHPHMFVQVLILLFNRRAAGGSIMHLQRCNTTTSWGQKCLHLLYSGGHKINCLILYKDNSFSEDQIAAILTEVSTIKWGQAKSCFIIMIC